MVERPGRGRRRPVMLCILDGWGYREATEDNAVALARTPIFDRLWRAGPRCLLSASGEDVGLPDGQIGNSEVGHMNLGAGRVVMQELGRIDRAVREGELARNAALLRLIDALRASGGRCHLMGLLSPGGVHAHQDHMAALARIVAGAGVPVMVHAFLDGRDTPPSSAEGYLERFIADTAECGDRVALATVSGRYHAMDRDKRWDRTGLAYDAIVLAEGERAPDPLAAVRESYRRGVTDEFVRPAVIDGYRGMAEEGDGVLVANFRADRVRQTLAALLEPDFRGFRRRRVPRFAATAGMASYSEELDRHLGVLFPPGRPRDLMGEVVARAGLRQLRLAETEKYPHVTYFFNGGEEQPFDGEERVLVPSPKVATYDLQPEMSAPEVTERLVEAIDSGRFDFILVNYANPDMVGHTGRLDAAVRAVETVDAALGRALDALGRAGGAALVTADHGNAELMRDPETGEPHTAHTLSPVPCVLVGGPEGATLRDGGRLADAAPTLLELLGLPQPAAMTGRSLIEGRDDGP